MKFSLKYVLVAGLILVSILTATALLTVSPDSYTRFMIYIPQAETVIGDGNESSQYSVSMDPFMVSRFETTNREFVEVYNQAIAWNLAEIQESKVWVHPDTGIRLQFPLLDTAIPGCELYIENNRIAIQPNADLLPVVGVSWYGAALYCNYLSRIEGFAALYDTIEWTPKAKKRGYRLPEYEEWEYAARGGNKTLGYRFSGSNDPLEVGWFKENAHGGVHPVGSKKPNELGLFDMSGNLHEFMSEILDPLRTKNYKPDTNGFTSGGLVTSGRIWRGGAWNKDPVSVFFFRQNINQPDYCLPYPDIGFRIVFTRPGLAEKIRAFFQPEPALPRR